MIDGKKHLHIVLEMAVYDRWIKNRRVNNATERLNQLIRMDSNITEQEKDRFKVLEEIRITENELQSLRIALNDIDELISEELAKQAELEKLPKKEEKCQKCGQNMPFGAKNHRFGDVLVCNPCFLSANANDIARWKEEYPIKKPKNAKN